MGISLDDAQMSQSEVTLQGKIQPALLTIIRDNLPTKYASQAASLAVFRDAISRHGGTKDDATLLSDFRTHVPLSDYESYRPFVNRFNAKPCMEQDVEDLLAPGLPDYFALSSATSGTSPKVFPKYNHSSNVTSRSVVDPDSKYPFAALVCTGYRDVKEIERTPGEVVQRIPLGIYSGGRLRRIFGFYIDDESKLSLYFPGYAVPWAATVILHFPSFLIIHALFFLSKGDVNRFYAPYATQFVDLICHIDEHWDMLVSCIQDGTIPDLEGIDHVRKYLQTHFHPNPMRAAELRAIGPPFLFEGWLPRIWPNASHLLTICSGPFATVLPRVRSILGPNVPIRVPGYGSTEAQIGPPFDPNKLDEFVLRSDDYVEFLDISLDSTHEQLFQAWEVGVGKSYEPILTTRDGLWRYRLGDVIHIVGFESESGAPLFKFVGRRSSTIHLPHTQVTEDQLLTAIRTFSSEGIIEIQEFTTVLDDRTSMLTLGFIIELAEPLGPDAHLGPQKLFDALAETNSEHKAGLAYGRTRLPTIRIVRPGTFAEYRHWKGECANIASGQVKVPLILANQSAQEWVLKKVVQEV